MKLVKPKIPASDAALGIDRRQRLAATMLLMGFDLPAPAHHAARQMQTAARITPGCTMDEFPGMFGSARKAMLQAAAGLIADMLAELAAAPTVSIFTTAEAVEEIDTVANFEALNPNVND